MRRSSSGPCLAALLVVCLAVGAQARFYGGFNVSKGFNLSAALENTIASIKSGNATKNISKPFLAKPSIPKSLNLSAALENQVADARNRVDSVWNVTSMQETMYMSTADPEWPHSKDPSGKPSGTCKPFVPPAPYKTVNEYCEAMKNMPKEYFTKLYNDSAAKLTDPFPLKGCVFGCIVSTDRYTELQRNFARTFGWSGKCFSEETDVNGVPKRFGSTLQRDYWADSGKNQSQRVDTYNGSGEFVFGGTGYLATKAIWDGKPAWHYVDDRPSPRMMFAGGWRTRYTMFQAVGDGVVDEFRSLGNGHVIGKTFYHGPNGMLPNALRYPRDTNFFMLFQACTADGKIAWKPQQRDLPLVGAP